MFLSFEPLPITLISSFSISGLHECDMLFMHLEAESNFVDRWIITDNTFDFHRRDKGHCIDSILNAPRFQCYRDRIFINKVSFPSPHTRYFRAHPVYQPYYDTGYFFIPEQLQRLSALTYMLHNNFDYDNTYILVADLDEFYVPSTSDHTQLLAHLEKSAPTKVGLIRRKYHLDYHNISMQFRITPLVNLAWGLISPFTRIAQARFTASEIFASSSHMISEYHNCFLSTHLLDKFRSHPHTVSYSYLEFKLASRMNHVVVPLEKLTNLPTDADIRCEILHLSDPLVHPFVRKNRHLLTGSVDTSYISNRKSSSIYNSWCNPRA